MSRKTVIRIVGIVAVVIVVAIVLNVVGGGDALGTVAAHAGTSYLGIAGLVFADAICPVFPGETTMNAAATLAAQGSLDLLLVIIAGAVGAIVGDSTLYWIARLFSDRLSEQVDKAKQNDKVAGALDLLGDSAPTLLVIGRFVPGVRFVVNSTYGIAKLPYRRFLLWSAIGGALWSVYTCLLAYAVGTALADFPLASVVISGAITTIAVAAVLWKLRRDRQQRKQHAVAGGAPEA
jgi:membrane protein DedA with SNARE-associated domain